jgi:hypothetical protein
LREQIRAEVIRNREERDIMVTIVQPQAQAIELSGGKGSVRVAS